MSNKKKVYVVGNSLDYANWLHPIGYIFASKLEEADLVLFTGGEDICPELYGEQKGKYTSFNKRRDDFEQICFNKALELKIPCLGACRGNQFLVVMNSGKLIQHMSHNSSHNILTFDGKILPVTSSHHQMAYPYNLPEEDFQILGWAPNFSHTYLNGKDEEIDMKDKKEVEIIFFPKTKCLGIQSHPEWMDLNCDTVKYMQGLVLELLNKE